MSILALIVLLGTCSLPPMQYRPPSSIQLARLVADQNVPIPTSLPHLPTVTPWPTATATVLPSMTPEPTATLQPTSAARNAVPTLTPDHHELAATIDAYMNDLVQAGYFSGAVLVAHNDDVILSKGYGLANTASNTPHTPQTRIRLASLTKGFTAVAILMLHARDQLDIHDPICTYVPDCPAAWNEITIHHLLTHSSGIPNYTDFAEFASIEMLPTTLDALISRFKYQPLLFEPGTTFSYGNSNYVLLGLIIERVSERSYEEFLHANIFAPLQMKDTGYYHVDAGASNQAVGYVTVGEPATFIDPSTLHAAGALYSTVEDLYRWDQALYSEQLLPKDLLDEMFTPVLGEYGYGWRIQGHLGHRLINHPGLISGFSNYMGRYPDDRLTIIVLSNLQSSAPVTVGLYLAQLVFESDSI